MSANQWDMPITHVNDIQLGNWINTDKGPSEVVKITRHGNHIYFECANGFTIGTDSRDNACMQAGTWTYGGPTT